MIKLWSSIPPGDLAVNRAWRKSKKGLVKSKLYRSSMEILALELVDAAKELGISRSVRVAIEEWWPGPQGDVDAPIKGVLDALQKSGIITNDSQVVELCVNKHMNAEVPGLEISIWEK